MGRFISGLPGPLLPGRSPGGYQKRPGGVSFLLAIRPTVAVSMSEFWQTLPDHKRMPKRSEREETIRDLEKLTELMILGGKDDTEEFAELMELLFVISETRNLNER